MREHPKNYKGQQCKHPMRAWYIGWHNRVYCNDCTRYIGTVSLSQDARTERGERRFTVAPRLLDN